MELTITITVPLSGAIGQAEAEAFAESVRQSVEDNASAWLPDSVLPAGEIVAGVLEGGRAE
jgi:hypothetical protein